MDDASLEDFLDQDDETQAVNADAEPTADPGVAPATPTYRWTPSDFTCAECDTQTQRGWHGDDGLVCPDCKEW